MGWPSPSPIWGKAGLRLRLAFLRWEPAICGRAPPDKKETTATVSERTGDEAR